MCIVYPLLQKNIKYYVKLRFVAYTMHNIYCKMYMRTFSSNLLNTIVMGMSEEPNHTTARKLSFKNPYKKNPRNKKLEHLSYIYLGSSVIFLSSCLSSCHPVILSIVVAER
jgi:hypothetical protein